LISYDFSQSSNKKFFRPLHMVVDQLAANLATEKDSLH